MVQIICDYREWDEEIDRIADMPNAGMKIMLEGTWLTIFEATQAIVHVETGSLKSSVKMTADSDGDNWNGEITVGGTSTGVHNPIDYAVYEHARGGAHDFMAEAELSQPQMIETLVEGLQHAK